MRRRGFAASLVHPVAQGRWGLISRSRSLDAKTRQLRLLLENISIPRPAEGRSISPSFGVLHQLPCLDWETLACSAAVTLFTRGCGSPASNETVLPVACFHQQFAATGTAFAMRLALPCHRGHLQE